MFGSAECEYRESGQCRTPASAPFRCLQVWGGNQSADLGVSMPALDAVVLAEPLIERDGTTNEEAAGGDVHFLSSCGTGRIVRAMLADVSGHGPSVAKVAGTLRRLMQRHMNALDQTSFVTALNRAFAAEGEGGGEGRFATSLAMTFFSPTGRLDLCNAGHPRPLLRRARTGRWRLLKAPESGETSGADLSNLPLGVLEPTRYEEFSVGLEEGDLVVAYTDAVIESRDQDGRMLGESGLLDFVAGLSTDDPSSLPRLLRERLLVRSAGRPIDDDLTIILLRCTLRRTQAPFLARLWAGVRFLGLLGRSALGGAERPSIPWPQLRIENTLGAIVPPIARRWRAPDSERET